MSEVILSHHREFRTLTGALLGLSVLPYEAASHDEGEQQEEDQAQCGPFHFHLLCVVLLTAYR